MAALKRKKNVHMNIESSSSSDEEERQKLQSSVWQPTNVIKLNSNCYSNTSSTNKPTVSQDGSLPPSKREDNSKSFNVTDDYRVTEMTPEYKSFVAKKLTTYLDDFLADVKDDESKWQSKVKLPEDDESFRLFSTSSNSYVPPKEKLPQAPWKSKKKRNADGDALSSSSSSDSDEERLRLEAVAVSADFIFRGARGFGNQNGNGLKEEEGGGREDEQVTSNPLTSSLTNNTSPHDGSNDQNNVKRKKKKKKKAKDEMVPPVNGVRESLTIIETNEEEVGDGSVVKKRKKDKAFMNLISDTREPTEVVRELEAGSHETLANFPSTKLKRKKKKKMEKEREK